MRIFFVCLLVPLCMGKIFQKCELAYELKNKFAFTPDEVKNFVCIAQFESAFNTEAINNYNWDGSRDFGIFQLNNRYWCGSEYGKNVCNMDCNDLLDDDLSDDIKCARKIVKETKRWMKSGNGLEAWTAYVKQCQAENLDEYISECADLLADRAEETTFETPTTISDDITGSVTEYPEISNPVGEVEQGIEYPVDSQATDQAQEAADSSLATQPQSDVQESPAALAPVRASGLGVKPEDQVKQDLPQSIAPIDESSANANKELSSSQYRPPVRASGLGSKPAVSQLESSPTFNEGPARVSGMVDIPITQGMLSPELEIAGDFGENAGDRVVISGPQEIYDGLTVELQNPTIVDQEPLPVIVNLDKEKPFGIKDPGEITGAAADKATTIKEEVESTPSKDDGPKRKVPSKNYFPSIIPPSVFSQFSLPIPLRQSFPFSPSPLGLLDMLLRGASGSPSVIFIAQLPNSAILNNLQRFTSSQSYRPGPNIPTAFSSQFIPLPYGFEETTPSDIASYADIPAKSSDFRKIPLPEFEYKPVEVPTLLGFRPHEIPLKPIKLHLPEFGSRPLEVPKLGLSNFDIPFPKLEFVKKPITLPTLSLQPLVLPQKKPLDLDFTKVFKPLEIPKITKVPLVIPEIPKKQINIDIKPIEIPKISFKPLFSKPSFNIFKKGD